MCGEPVRWRVRVDVNHLCLDACLAQLQHGFGAGLAHGPTGTATQRLRKARTMRQAQHFGRLRYIFLWQAKRFREVRSLQAQHFRKPSVCLPFGRPAPQFLCTRDHVPRHGSADEAASRDLSCVRLRRAVVRLACACTPSACRRPTQSASA